MKMKNLFLGVSLLAIAGMWTGCSNDDEVANPKQIAFHVQGGVPNPKIPGTTVDQVNAFVVFGSDDQATSNIFHNITVARQAGSGNVFDYQRNYQKIFGNSCFVRF